MACSFIDKLACMSSVRARHKQRGGSGGTRVTRLVEMRVREDRVMQHALRSRHLEVVKMFMTYLSLGMGTSSILQY